MQYSILAIQSACVVVFNSSKTGLIPARFQKFCQGSILQMCKILLGIHLTIMQTFMPPKFSGSTRRTAHTPSKTILCAQSWPRKCHISSPCSNIWQIFNAKVVRNVMFESCNQQAYLDVPQAPEDNSMKCMRNEHANNVAKMSPRRPK